MEDLTREQVTQLVTEVHMKEFDKWITGQGCPMFEDGTLGYFEHDVSRFLKYKLTWRTLKNKEIFITDIETKHLENIIEHLKKRIIYLRNKEEEHTFNSRIYEGRLESSWEWIERAKIELKARI